MPRHCAGLAGSHHPRGRLHARCCCRAACTLVKSRCAHKALGVMLAQAQVHRLMSAAPCNGRSLDRPPSSRFGSGEQRTPQAYLYSTWICLPAGACKPGSPGGRCRVSTSMVSCISWPLNPELAASSADTCTCCPGHHHVASPLLTCPCSEHQTSAVQLVAWYRLALTSCAPACGSPEAGWTLVCCCHALCPACIGCNAGFEGLQALCTRTMHWHLQSARALQGIDTGCNAHPQ